MESGDLEVGGGVNQCVCMHAISLSHTHHTNISLYVQTRVHIHTHTHAHTQSWLSEKGQRVGEVKGIGKDRGS